LNTTLSEPAMPLGLASRRFPRCVTTMNVVLNTDTTTTGVVITPIRTAISATRTGAMIATAIRTARKVRDTPPERSTAIAGMTMRSALIAPACTTVRPEA